MTLVLHKSQVHYSGFIYSDELAVHLCQLLFLQRQVAKLASGLFYRWSLLRNMNMATNLQRFTSNISRRLFCPMNFRAQGVSRKNE